MHGDDGEDTKRRRISEHGLCVRSDWSDPCACLSPPSSRGGLKRKASDLVAGMQGDDSNDTEELGIPEAGLSARERNQLRRKQRKRARDAKDEPLPPLSAVPSGSAGKTEVSVTDQPQDDK